MYDYVLYIYIYCMLHHYHYHHYIPISHHILPFRPARSQLPWKLVPRPTTAGASTDMGKHPSSTVCISYMYIYIYIYTLCMYMYMYMYSLEMDTETDSDHWCHFRSQETPNKNDPIPFYCTSSELSCQDPKENISSPHPPQFRQGTPGLVSKEIWSPRRSRKAPRLHGLLTGLERLGLSRPWQSKKWRKQMETARPPGWIPSHGDFAIFSLRCSTACFPYI